MSIINKHYRIKKQKRLSKLKKKNKNIVVKNYQVSQQILDYEKVLKFVKESYVLDEFDKVHIENMKITLGNIRDRYEENRLRDEFEKIFCFIVSKIVRKGKRKLPDR